MSTPSLQTFVTDASQVLNLGSISAVRSVVAVALANANAGTPLNPNLTTQQLWNEFYQVVTEPKSNIESFIANQMMKFFFSPPAPGGVGSDKQVIFNDMGVLAGDTKFLWDKNANRLDVDGPVVITGALTVDTSTLKVDSTNHRVIVGHTSGSAAFQVTNAGAAGLEIQPTGFSSAPLIQSYNRSGSAYTQLTLDASTIVHALSGTTAMTLDSTGLGIGVAPVADCKLTIRGGSIFDRGVTGGSPQLLLSLAASSGGNFGQISNTGTRWALGFGATLTTVGTEALVWDSSGNVGIGITPSTAWNTGTNLQVGAQAALYSNSALGAVDLSSNSVRTGNDTYQYLLAGSNQASRFQQRDGAFRWFSATAGTSPNAITFGDAKMTLDATGNLMVGTATAGAGAIFKVTGAVADGKSFEVYGTASSTNSAFYCPGSGSVNGVATGAGAGGLVIVNKDSGNLRSISAAGSINASGADYAEYMTKSGDFVIAKGDVAGIDANGKLTNVFADAVSFVVKSTDPSYVGNDKWGVDLEGDALETARQLVDRIAFAGQVPVNVTAAKAGDYIVPVVNGTGIKGISVSNPTFEQYQLAVGKVIAIDTDGRARIIVKVA